MKRNIIFLLQSFIIIILIKRMFLEMDKYWTSEAKTKKCLTVMKKWIKLEGSCAKIAQYLNELRIRRIAIYGMGFLGEHLYRSLLKFDNIEIVYGIDQNAKNLEIDLPVYSMDDKNMPKEKLDAIIISNFCGCGDIVKKLQQKYDQPKILILEDIIDYITCSAYNVTIY